MTTQQLDRAAIPGAPAAPEAMVQVEGVRKVIAGKAVQTAAMRSRCCSRRATVKPARR